jgi:hypothetical protein
VFWHGVAYLIISKMRLSKCFFTALQHDEIPCVLSSDTNQKHIKNQTMKKSILSLAIVLTLFSTAFANLPSSTTERAARSFQQEFSHATEVKWAETNNYVLATFHQDKQTLFAYYDFQGNLIGVVQHILTTSLPQSLQNDIKKHYGNYWVSELFQVKTEEGVNFYLELKNADESIVLTSEGNNGWNHYSVTRVCEKNL